MTSSNRRASPHGTETRGRRHKCCIGALYYSQALMDQRSTPICGGLRKTRHNQQDLQELQTESANLVDFKYVCVGYSVYDEDRMRQQPDRINMAEGEVTLPYCEGVEIISSRQLQQGPVLLKEGMDGESVGSNDVQGSKKKRGLFGRGNDLPAFVTQPGKINWDQFPDRFFKSSTMIVTKMRHNARHMVESVKRLLDR